MYYICCIYVWCLKVRHRSIAIILDDSRDKDETTINGNETVGETGKFKRQKA